MYLGGDQARHYEMMHKSLGGGGLETIHKATPSVHLHLDEYPEPFTRELPVGPRPLRQGVGPYFLQTAHPESGGASAVSSLRETRPTFPNYGGAGIQTAVRISTYF